MTSRVTRLLSAFCFALGGLTLAAQAATPAGYEKIKVLKGHSGEITSVVFAADGKLMISGSDDKRVVVWDTASWKMVRAFEDHPGEVKALAVAPNGKFVVAGDSEEQVTLWEIATGKQLGRFEAADSVNRVDISPDGQMIAVATDDKTLGVYDLTGSQLKKLKGHGEDVNVVVFSPDGKMLASGSDDKMVILWSLEKGEPIRILRGHSGSVLSLAFSPDGKHLVSGGRDNIASVWDVQGDGVEIFSEHGDTVRAMSYQPGGRLVASAESRTSVTVGFWGVSATPTGGSEGCRILFWDPLKTKTLFQLPGDCGVRTLRFSPDGALLVTGGELMTIYRRR